MKPMTTLICGACLAGFTIACIVGAKVAPPKQEAANSTLTGNDARSLDRAGERASGTLAQSSSGRSSLGANNAPLDFTAIMEQIDPIERSKNLLYLLDRLNPDEFEEITADLLSSGYRYDRRNNYEIILYAWAKVDPLAALEFQKQVTFRDRDFRTISASWAEEDPDASLQWLENKKGVRDRDSFMRGVIQGIAGKDPQRATEVMNSMQGTRNRIEATKTITPYIARLGQDEVTQWLDTIEEKFCRDAASQQYATTLAYQNPESAAAWLREAELGKNRIPTIRDVAREWAARDAAAARAWAESLSGDEQKTALGIITFAESRQNSDRASE